MNKSLISVTSLALILTLTQTPFAQQEGTRFSNQAGVELYIPPGMDSVIDNPLSDNLVFNIFPPENQPQSLAKAVVYDGTQETRLSGKKIVFQLASEEFLLEGQGKIVQAGDVLTGPEKIEYDSETLTMTALGTKNNPVTFLFTRDDGMKNYIECRELQFIFEENDGSRELAQLKIIENYKTHIAGEAGDSGSAPGLGPKLSR